MSSHDFDAAERKQTEFLQQADIPNITSIWQHYRGDYYIVHGFVTDESTEGIAVCYSKLDRPLPIPWTRPISEWTATVEYDGKRVKRFTKIKDLSTDVNHGGCCFCKQRTDIYLMKQMAANASCKIQTNDDDNELKEETL
jgi:hypothetical protein